MAERTRTGEAAAPLRRESAPHPLEILEDLVGDEVLEWYLMTPAERWAESERLWATYRLLGGSLDAEPDSQSPFDVQGTRSQGTPHGRTGVHTIRRSGV